MFAAGLYCDKILMQTDMFRSFLNPSTATIALGAVLLWPLAAQSPHPSQPGTAAQTVSGASSQKSGATPATERALLDQYCVTCHNDKTKIANFSLQSADLNTVAETIRRSGNA